MGGSAYVVVALTAPNPLAPVVNPPNGLLWADTSVADPTAWFVKTAGDTMTGPLTISTGTSGGMIPQLALSVPTAADFLWAEFRMNNVLRWVMQWVDNGETGTGNAGSDFQLQRYSNAGGYLDAPLTIVRASGQAIVRGDNAAAPGLVVRGTAGAWIGGQNASGLYRWSLSMPNGESESTGNAGSNFSIDRYADAGGIANYIDSPLSIGRATGATTLNGGKLTVNGADAVESIGLQLNGATVGPAPGWAQLFLNGRASALGDGGNWIGGRRGGVDRWGISVGDQTAETGSGNVGTDFSITRFSDAGSGIDNPLMISRSSGQTSFFASPVRITTAAGSQALIQMNATRMWQAGQNVDGTYIVYDGTAGGVRFGISTLGDASFSGALTVAGPITTTGASVNISSAVAAGHYISGQTLGSLRWVLYLGNGAAETGANAGSDCNFNMYNDGGAYLGTPLGIRRADGLVSFGYSSLFVGPATFQSASNQLAINSGAGTERRIMGMTNNVLRWYINMGSTGAETGSNNGSDWQLNAASDAGAYNGTPISVKRSTNVVTFAAAIVNGPSDRTLKQDVAPLEGSLAKVLALQGVSFSFKATPEKREIGLIAQDVEPIVPEVIQEYRSGEDEPKLGIDYPKLVALLVEAVKELAAR